MVLACVTSPYVADALMSLEPSLGVYESLQRLQWLGIALVPAALFHLSDALLATTGLPSRGRRRRIIRILYAIGVAFFIAAALTKSWSSRFIWHALSACGPTTCSRCM